MKLKLVALLFAILAVVLVTRPGEAAETGGEVDIGAASDGRGTSPTRNLVWVSPSVGYSFHRKSDDFFYYTKTADSGATWT
ncbi:hypothetical protein LCGC14_0348040, partial [marine sediment metagenome]